MVAKWQISYNVYFSKHFLDAHGFTLTFKCHVQFKNTLKQSLVHFHKHKKNPITSKSLIKTRKQKNVDHEPIQYNGKVAKKSKKKK